MADIESTLSSELEYVSNWLIDNKLSLHLGKTQSILFGTKRRLSTGVKLNVICNGNVIESKSNVTYLCVTLDQFLSGEIIASNILYKSSNKLKFYTGILVNLTSKQKTVDICFDSMSF